MPWILLKLNLLLFKFVDTVRQLIILLVFIIEVEVGVAVSVNHIILRVPEVPTILSHIYILERGTMKPLKRISF